MSDKHAPPDELARVQRISRLLDSAVRVPGTPLSFGLDGILGLIPGIGDSATLMAGLWIVDRAHRMGVRRRVLFRMLMNLGLDWLIGLVPFLGDLFDFVWKANRRNVELIEVDLKRQGKT